MTKFAFFFQRKTGLFREKASTSNFFLTKVQLPPLKITLLLTTTNLKNRISGKTRGGEKTRKSGVGQMTKNGQK